MIGAPNSLNLNCKVRVMKDAPGPSVSEEIADIFTNYNIDGWKLYIYCRVFILHHTIVVCLSTPWGIKNKLQVDVHLAVFNDKRSSKSATSFSHLHSLTNWYAGYMLDDQ